MQATLDSTLVIESKAGTAPTRKPQTDSNLGSAALNLALSLVGTGAVALLVKTCAGPGSWAYGFFFERQFVQWIIVWMCVHGLVEVARRVPVWLRERRGLQAWQRGGSPAANTGLVYERHLRVQQLLDCAPVVDIRDGARQISEQAAAQLDARYSAVNVLTHLASYCGFFGTVLGLSVGLFHAFGGTGTLSLKSFGAAVSTSFDTTLSGVACTILLMMVQSIVRSREEGVLAATDQLADDALLRHEQATASSLGVSGLTVSPQNYGELFRRAVEMIASQVREVAGASQQLSERTQAVVVTLSRTNSELQSASGRIEETAEAIESSRASLTNELAALSKASAENAQQLATSIERAAADQARNMAASVESSNDAVKTACTHMAGIAQQQAGQVAAVIRQGEQLAAQLAEVKVATERPRRATVEVL